MGVAVGMSVGINVAVAGKVTVGVSVGVDISPVPPVPAGGFRNAKNTTMAAKTISTARMPTAAGRLKVTSGMRLACTDLSAFFTTLASGRGVNSVPHTRQRVALSLKRVPHVGHIFVLFEVGAGLIGAEIIPLNVFANFLLWSPCKMLS